MICIGTHRASRTRQRGAVTLLVAVVLLLGITFIVFFANRTVVFEQRTSANQVRSTKALQAAEAGIEWALAQLNTPVNLGSACTVAGGTALFRDNYLNPADADPPVYGTASGAYSSAQPACVRQSAGGWSCSCPAGTSATVGAPTCDDTTGACPKFVVRFERVQDPALGNTCASDATNCVMSTVKVTATGFTDTNTPPDGTATVSQIVRTVPALATPPAAALTAKDTVDISGDITVTNTDPATNGITISSGGATTLSGSAAVATIAGTPPAASIYANDPTLSAMSDEQMFRTYFGVPKSEFRNMPTTKQITCGPCHNADLDAAISGGANVVWVNGDLDLNANSNYGSARKPVIVTVTGNIQVNGNVNVYGIMYSQAAVWDNSGGGTATICGAAIAEGSFTGQGTPNTTYCPNVFKTLKGTTGSFEKVPGSWRDF
jgi:Tfp pilus assembly protein PilX